MLISHISLNSCSFFHASEICCYLKTLFHLSIIEFKITTKNKQKLKFCFEKNIDLTMGKKVIRKWLNQYILIHLVRCGLLTALKILMKHQKPRTWLLCFMFLFTLKDETFFHFVDFFFFNRHFIAYLHRLTDNICLRDLNSNEK